MFLVFLPCLCLGACWLIDGDNGIVYESPRDVSDNFEMSSRGVDAVVRWRIDESGAWHREGTLRFPTLRAGKDDTYGSWKVDLNDDMASEVKVDGRNLSCGVVEHVKIGAALVAEIDHSDEEIRETRTLFPALSATAFLEHVALRNESEAG